MFTAQQSAYLEILADLHSDWQPHAGQLTALRPIIDGTVDDLFLQCGRKFGKTESVIYLLRRFALLTPNLPCYYVGPTKVHARSLIWTDPRLKRWSHHYKYSGDDLINESEMIVRFKNGSYIQILGSENHYAANGLRPGIIVYDEFAEFDDKFDDIMQPNRAVYMCPKVIVGTPPARKSKNRKQYIARAQECKTQPRALWIKRSSWDNPHISREFLQKEKEGYYRRNEGHLWELYYEANIVNGGRNVVFPMVNEERHIVPHASLMPYILGEQRNFDFFTTVSPDTTQPTGALFVGIHKYTRHVYILDELYESAQERNRTQSVVQQLIKQAEELIPRLSFESDWIKSQSPGAPWFSAEAADSHDVSFLSVDALSGKKDSGISLIKDLLTNNHVHISSRCKTLFDQLCAYITKDDGTLIKGEDALINALRYTLIAAHYTVLEGKEIKETLGPRVIPYSDAEIWDKWDKDDDADWL